MAVAMYCSEMRPSQTHSSPLEAAEAGTQTVGHIPQGCRPFRVSPPMPLSVSNYVSFPRPALTVDPTVARRFAGLQLMRIIGETRSPVKKIQQNRQREIGHLDKPTLRKQSILKTLFQNPRFPVTVCAPACKNQNFPSHRRYRVQAPHKCQGMSLLMPSRFF
jgi:hypothetical protein